MSDNGQVKLIQSDLQRVERVIEAMRQELGASNVEVFTLNGRWEIVWGFAERDSTELFVTANSLADAYTAALQEMAQAWSQPNERPLLVLRRWPVRGRCHRRSRHILGAGRGRTGR